MEHDRKGLSCHELRPVDRRRASENIAAAASKTERAGLGAVRAAAVAVVAIAAAIEGTQVPAGNVRLDDEKAGRWRTAPPRTAPRSCTATIAANPNPRRAGGNV